MNHTVLPVGTSGKASHGIATHVPGTAIQAANANASGLAGEMARTRQALDERGEKLGQLEMRSVTFRFLSQDGFFNGDNSVSIPMNFFRSEAMKEAAKEYSSNATALMNKYRDSKWYQL